MKKSTTLTIEKATQADIVAVGAFYDEVVQYLDEHVNYPKWTYKVYPSEQFAREMTERNWQYVCYKNGQIVATFVLNEDPQGAYCNAKWSKSLADGEYLVIHALAVAASMQGKGIGKQIVRFCANFAREHGYKAIRLDVVPTNYPARKLYEQCAFRYFGDVDLERGYEEIPLFSMYELLV